MTTKSSRELARYNERKLSGRCTKCNRMRGDSNSSTLCEICYRHFRAARDARRARSMAAGLCCTCGGVRGSSGSSSLCVSCYEKAKRANRETCAKRRLAGLCKTCGIECCGLLCERCIDRRRRYLSKYYNKLKSNRRCACCGKKTARNDRILCEECGVKAIIRAREWKRQHRRQVNQRSRDLLKADPQKRISHELRVRFGKAFRCYLKGTRKKSSVRDLGCTIGELCTHLERMFVAGMNWANYGQWHIDHVRPLSSFDLTDPEQQKQAVNFSNLQPLWEKDNLSKGCKTSN